MKKISTKEFSSNFIEINEKKLKTSNLLTRFYEGYLADEPDDSHVNGFILNGLFYGNIRSKKDGSFNIEHSKPINKSNTIELIIYKNEDVKFDNLKFKPSNGQFHLHENKNSNKLKVNQFNFWNFIFFFVQNK